MGEIVAIEPLSGKVKDRPAIAFAMVFADGVISFVYNAANGGCFVAPIEDFVSSVQFDYRAEKWVDTQEQARQQMEGLAQA